MRNFIFHVVAGRGGSPVRVGCYFISYVSAKCLVPCPKSRSERISAGFAEAGRSIRARAAGTIRSRRAEDAVVPEPGAAGPESDRSGRRCGIGDKGRMKTPPPLMFPNDLCGADIRNLRKDRVPVGVCMACGRRVQRGVRFIPPAPSYKVCRRGGLRRAYGWRKARPARLRTPDVRRRRRGALRSAARPLP